MFMKTWSKDDSKDDSGVQQNLLPTYSTERLSKSNITLSTSSDLEYDVVGFGSNQKSLPITVSDVLVQGRFSQAGLIKSTSDMYWEVLNMSIAMQKYASDHKLLRGQCEMYDSFLHLYTFNLYGLEPAMKHGLKDDESRRIYDSEAKNDYQLDLFVQLFKQAQSENKMCVIGLQEVDICPAKLLYSLKNDKMEVDKQSMFEKITGKIFDDDQITVKFTSHTDRKHMVDSLRQTTLIALILDLKRDLASSTTTAAPSSST